MAPVMKPREFCITCGEEVLRCKGCGEIIRKNLGWEIIFNTDVPGSYHSECAKSLVRVPFAPDFAKNVP